LAAAQLAPTLRANQVTVAPSAVVVALNLIREQKGRKLRWSLKTQ
jgi:hypothetical protein